MLELLVVIAIIAVLAALLFPAASAVRDMARRQKARSDELAIANAVKAFRNVYGRYPNQTQGAVDITYKDGTEGTTMQGEIFKALMATDPALNRRKTVFLEENPPGPYTCVVSGCWLDPWGDHYILAMDENGDGKVELTCGALSTTLVGRAVAVATTNGTRSVFSWQ